MLVCEYVVDTDAVMVHTKLKRLDTSILLESLRVRDYNWRRLRVSLVFALIVQEVC